MERRPAVPNPWAPVLDGVCTCCTGSETHLRRLGDGDPRTRVSGHEECGCRPCLEVGGCLPPARGLALLETGEFSPVWSGGQLSRTPGLQSWVKCVLAALGNGADFGRLRDGHEQRGCRPCHEVGGSRPPAWGLDILETGGPVLSGAAAYLSRTPRFRARPKCLLAAPGSVQTSDGSGMAISGHGYPSTGSVGASHTESLGSVPGRSVC